MKSTVRTPRGTLLRAALVAALGVPMACSGRSTTPAPTPVAPSSGAGAATAPVGEDAGAIAVDASASTTASTDGGMPQMAPSRLAAALIAHHVDIEHTPRLDGLSGDARDLVMQSFTEALNVRCVYCHVDGDFAAPTVRKAVTKVMWNQFVHGLRLRDHTAGTLYCDSCHQGQARFLARGDEDALSEYMGTNYVTPLEQADAQPSRCTFCHGQPFHNDFLPRRLARPAH